MKYKAVIFDLDGTLLDTIEDIKETMNQVLRKYNYQEYSQEEYKYFVGKGVDNLIKQVMKSGNIEQEAFAKLKKGYYEVYVKQATVNTKIYEGINELLTELKQKGISLNVLSNKPHSQTKEVIKHYFGDNVFDLVYGKKEEFLPKPHPDSASDLIANLKLNPDEILYVGDTETDMFTAKNAKFYSIGVLWGFRKKSELVNAGADKIIENPLEILELFS